MAGRAEGLGCIRGPDFASELQANAISGFMGNSVAPTHCKPKETIMRKRFSGSMTIVAIAAAAGSVVISAPTTMAQAPAASGTTPAPAPSPKTAWGEPDLQGIWTDETTTPLQRPAKYAN
jgi:hypothetical protein